MPASKKNQPKRIIFTLNNNKSINITTSLVKNLISEQFPQYKTLNIKPVEFSGIDNRTYHLGNDMLIRLPSAEGYAAQALKEQKWLPELAKHLSIQIPTPLHLGKPNQDYPWNWSIYRFIFGTSVNQLKLSSDVCENLAKDLAKFIKELHKTPTNNAPHGDLHNYYRGCHPCVYDSNTRADIQTLSSIIDADKALALWETATSSKWEPEPVWVHGDMAIGNILIQDGKLAAVIDFGCMGIGDPACDLVIAWTFFDGEARKIFKDTIGLDANTWNRARGWVLWKANFELAGMRDKSSPEALYKIKIITDVVKELK